MHKINCAGCRISHACSEQSEPPPCADPPAPPPESDLEARVAALEQIVRNARLGLHKVYG